MMKFWGVEVKSPDQQVEVSVGATKVVHLSQVSLGDAGNTAKKRSVYIYAHQNERKYFIGKLHSKKLHQQAFDLVFDQPFSISHTWKHGSVYFIGYEKDVAAEEHDSESEGHENHQPDVNDTNYAEPGKDEEEVHSDSTHESDLEALLYWPSSAPGNDTSEEEEEEEEELVDARDEEEERPANDDQNQGRVILEAIHIPSYVDRKRAEKSIGTNHPKMSPPRKKGIAAAVKKRESDDEDEDGENKQTGRKRKNESATTDLPANKKIKEEPQD